jgi:hypothetical protein
VVTAALGLVTATCFGTWFVTLALKLEGQWAVSWPTASFPLWLCYGFGLLYSFGTLLIRKPASGGMVMVRLVVECVCVCLGVGWGAAMQRFAEALG